jgi:hypothetical protein
MTTWYITVRGPRGSHGGANPIYHFIVVAESRIVALMKATALVPITSTLMDCVQVTDIHQLPTTRVPKREYAG